MDLHRVVRIELRGVLRHRVRVCQAEYTHQVLHGSLAGLVDALHKLQDVMCITIDDSDTDVVVVLVLLTHEHQGER